MYNLTVNQKSFTAEERNDIYNINGQEFTPIIKAITSTRFLVIMSNKVVPVVLKNSEDSKHYTFQIEGQEYEVGLKDPYDLLLEKLGMDKLLETAVEDVKAPMPGLVLDVMVASGQEVEKGDALLVLEAMKMENVIKANHSGVIKSICVSPKQAVEKNTALITFE